MKVYPAIDIKEGKCVRLTQGRAEDITAYGDPAKMAKRWVDQGAEYLHVVDLDGAFEGGMSNAKHISAICALGVPVQLGGGLRTLEGIRAALDLGVTRAILGTSAAAQPDFLKRACYVFGGDKIVCGIDAKNGRVMVKGWGSTADITPEKLAVSTRESGAWGIIFTDIATDGMMTGPNTVAMTAMAKIAGIPVIASGGVGSLDHITALKSTGVQGVILGKALYEGAFSLKEALERVKEHD